MARAFISYSRDDRDKAEVLASALNGLGCDAWFDKELVGGDEFQSVIEQKLSEVDAIIVLWTDSSVRKLWVQAEARLGLKRNCLVPARYDPNLAPPEDFGAIHAEFLGDWNGNRNAPEISKLVERIEKLKHARDAAQAAEKVPVQLREFAQKTNAVSLAFGASLPGGLPVYRFAIGVLLTSLGIWGVLTLANIADGGVDLGWIVLAAIGLGVARSMDQLLVAHKKRVSLRFFDTSFSQACAVAMLLAIILLVGTFLAARALDIELETPGMGDLALIAVQLALGLLVLGYAGRLLLLLLRSLAGRI